LDLLNLLQAPLSVGTPRRSGSAQVGVPSGKRGVGLQKSCRSPMTTRDPRQPSSRPAGPCVGGAVWSDAWLESGQAPGQGGTGWDLVPPLASPGGGCSVVSPARHDLSTRHERGHGDVCPPACLQQDGRCAVGFLHEERWSADFQKRDEMFITSSAGFYGEASTAQVPSRSDAREVQPFRPALSSSLRYPLLVPPAQITLHSHFQKLQAKATLTPSQCSSSPVNYFTK